MTARRRPQRATATSRRREPTWLVIAEWIVILAFIAFWVATTLGWWSS